MTQKIDKGWLHLLKLLTRVNQPQELDTLLRLLFTPDECDDIAKRVLIIKGLLAAQTNQRELAKDLGVSIAKITRGSNVLKTVESRLKTLLLEELA